MFGDLGAPELIIILLIVVVLFGAGRIGKLGKDVGTSVREFRRAVKDEDDEAASAQKAVSPASASLPESQPAPASTSAGPKPPIVF
jgi:sec-independent protein translocase protein TatA